MRDHFRTVKKNIDANIIHHSGGVAAPRGGSGKFPYSSPLILPKCATMQNTSGLPKLSPFLLKPLFAWIPEYLFPELALASGHKFYRCVRGKNSAEGYHRYLRTLFANFCASPWVCHSVLMEFNYRWNISRAVDNRGMVAEIGGFSHQYLIDQIQRVTASWYPGQPLYPEWLAPVDFEDSGERAGFGSFRLR
ncbi:unnamed protein product [Ectocarpus sp. CCAP 1310/34]|nr:unnamed protein product [Ectocarpus sp. CCAP 1310/34]